MSLNKAAPSFTPKWMSAPAPAPAAAAPAPTAAPAPAAEESKPKLSSTASSFVPRSMRVAAAAAPAPTPVAEKPKPVSELGALPPRAPQGAWGKGRPPVTHKAVSPAAKPATPAKKPGTPGSKPVTPGGRPAAPGEAYRPPQKLLTEVMIAAKAATLKKDAAVFVPKKGFPPPLKMVTPPVTPQHQPAANHADPTANMGEEHVADENAKMPLSRPWALYFVDRAPQGQAAYDPTLVYTMKSVEDFWRTINNVPSLTHGNPGSTYYFFRDGIHPKWEDAGNQGGGSWTMRLFSSRDLTSEAIDEIWDRLLCRAVGEAWPAALKGTLNGLVAKMRDRAITIQFWMTRRVDEFPAEIMTLIGDLYKAFTLDYISHEAAEEAAVEREKLEREKAKAQKKKDKKRH